MRCQYRVRWFSSKGAFLVLLWTTLISFVLSSLYYTFVESSIHYLNDLSTPMKWLLLITILVGFVSAPLFGWLADTKFGNYKVFKVGAVSLFITTVINCLFLILETQNLKINSMLTSIHLCLGYSFFMLGVCAYMVTALPLDLDQMPDASSSNIASYIAWLVCSFNIGSFIGQGLEYLRRKCIDKAMYSNYALIIALLLVLSMSIVLASSFLLSPKWLIIEPKSPQSLKTIYQVLKFAAKHNAPINRSTFTYWEEDIPSRIDLGKSKYGGPFTTEQVEDVKTVLRLLAINLPFSVIIFSFTILIRNFLGTAHKKLLVLNTCKMEVAHLFLNSVYWYGLLGIVAHEFLIYPFIRNRLPSILKRIGAATLLTTFITFSCFTLTLAHYLSQSSETATKWIAQILHQSTGGALFQLVVTLIVEFMCAQSPYNMRGLLLSSIMLLVFASFGVEEILWFCFTSVTHQFSTTTYCRPFNLDQFYGGRIPTCNAIRDPPLWRVTFTTQKKLGLLKLIYLAWREYGP